ncbi:hypothetical protein [Stygiolobus sp. RP850M]|uniref:hypothetical protein n=1 Tax=Stygiolobus sp. RP850M TaxID=3133137 RepID=UPI00307E7AAB
MEDFQNVLVTIGPPLSNYINNSVNENDNSYIGDNVVFLIYYNGKYYVLPSWYAGESNENYYFFINLLDIPSFYNSNNFGCNFLPIFVGFSNESLLPYLNGTIGGAPEALDPSDPYYAVMYDNGLNVFPIYVNFYAYPSPDQSNTYRIEDNENCGNSYGFPACYQNILYENVLPPYNNVTIYVNGTGITPSVETNGPLEGLVMDNGTNQGSYALITSNVLQNTFSQLSQSQNGLGLQTFAYFSGIPWEDSQPSTLLNIGAYPINSGAYPTVADAVVLSYVSYSGNGPFSANTVSDYNGDDSAYNWVLGPHGSHSKIGNQNIGINVGGNTYLPTNFSIFMYEYGWASLGSGCTGPGPGCSSGYYVGILQKNSTKGLGYFLTISYNNIPCSSNLCTSGYYDYYYSGTGWPLGIAVYNPNQYFVEDNNGNIEGYNEGSNGLPFIPFDGQYTPQYFEYGVFWLYNWFQAGNGNMNIYFLMNGNILGTTLASPEEYSFGGEKGHPIFPNPPASIFTQSYINAYNTAFNQPVNHQVALYGYSQFTSDDVNSNFIPGTFGYQEGYNSLSQSLYISYLQDYTNYYNGNPYLFVSAGSGGGTSYMYLDWIIVTYGVPYVVSVS